MCFMGIGATLPGHGKGRCEDACAIAVPRSAASGQVLAGQWIVGAIADGVGSCAHGRAAAHAAVRGALGELWQTPYVEELSASDAELRMRQSVRGARRCVHQVSLREHLPLSDLGCTLLVFAVSTNWTAAGQIGDGIIYIDDGHPLIRPMARRRSNRTHILLDPLWEQAFRFAYVPRGVELLVAMTDGLEDVSFVQATGRAHPPFIQVFQKWNFHYEHGADLESWLAGNTEVTDDQAIVVIRRVRE